MPGPELAVSRPGTLRDKVVEALRGAVISGRFAPDSRLVEREMCELLGVSRTLVRQALRQMEAEGWVRILPFRGPVVATLECELLDRRRFASQAEARMACFSFIEGWYNPVRLHSALGYRSPMAYEAASEAATAEL